MAVTKLQLCLKWLIIAKRHSTFVSLFISPGNENYLVREYGLTVMTRGISPTTDEEIVNAFLTAKAAGKWPQIRNHYEYFMKATLVWFDASQQSTQGECIGKVKII